MPLLPRTESVPVLLEIFKGHKEELLAIEDTQVKVTGVVLGIFGTGGAFLASMVNKSSRISSNERWGLTLITSAILLLAMVSGYHRHKARRGTRYLLERCEKALGLYESGAYIEGEQLYPVPKKPYWQKGLWLVLVNGLVLLAGIGFLVVLWSQS
jgi:hypothetical protein